MTRRRYKIKTFIKNTASLVGGTIVAQLLAIGFQLIIRRLYSPEDFGAFAVYASLIGILFIFANARYNETILLPKNDDDSKNLIGFSFLLSLLFSLFLFILLLFFKDKVSVFLNLKKNFENTLLLVPIGLFLFSNVDLFNSWLIRKKRFVLSGGAKVMRRGIDGPAQIFYGKSGVKFGLWFGDIIGQFVTLLYVSALSFKHDFSLKNISFKSMKNMAKRYSDFPKYSLFPTLLNSLSLAAPVLIINKFYSEEIVGFYDLTKMVLAIPLALVVKSLYNVILQSTSEKRIKKLSIKSDLWKVLISLSIASILLVLVIQIFSGFIFNLFGNSWTESISFAKILVFSFALKLLISPFSALFTSLERIKIGSMWQVGNFFILVIIYFVGGIEITKFLKIFVLLELVSYFVYGILILNITLKYERDIKNE